MEGKKGTAGTSMTRSSSPQDLFWSILARTTERGFVKRLALRCHQGAKITVLGLDYVSKAT
jgi:hypothetical protein